MTAAHAFFALMCTAYILVAIQFEERDLITAHGADYAEYRKRVPMLIPRPTRGAPAEPAPLAPAAN
jgi:protein-S-isoprenylcysteine O-methyltransferase Ste14